MAGEIGFEVLEQALMREAQAFAYPPTPALAGRVRAQLEVERRRPQPAIRVGRRLAWPALALHPALLALLALVIAGLALLAVSPEARTAFAGWLGGLRNLRIIFVPPTPTPTPTPTAIYTPTPGPSATLRPTPTATATPGIVGLTTLAEAQRTARFPIGLPHYPPGLGEPDQIYAQSLFDFWQQVILVYRAGPGTPAGAGGVLFTLYELQPRGLIEKGVSPLTVVEEVQVNGTPAVWLAGAAHTFQIRRENGEIDYESQRVVTGNTLAWEIGDVTYRLETMLPKEEAIRIAESVTGLSPATPQPVSLAATPLAVPFPQKPITATPLPAATPLAVPFPQKPITATPLPAPEGPILIQESLLLADMQTGHIQVIDPNGPTVLRSLSSQATGEASVVANDRVYSVNNDNTLVSVDIATGEQTTLATVPDVLRVIGSWPVPIAISPDGRRLVVAHYRSTGPGPAHEVTTFWLSVFDPDSGRLLSTIPPEPEHVKTSQAAACLIPPMMIAPDSRRLYELCLWGGSYPLLPTPMLRVVDLVEGKSLGTPALPGASVAALAPDGQRLYVLTRQGQLSVVDTEELAITGRVALGDLGGPNSIEVGSGRLVTAPDGKRLYVSDGQINATLYAIGIGTWRLASRIGLDESVQDMAVSADGQRLYVLTSKRLVILDAVDLHELDTLNLASPPSPGGYRMLIVRSNSKGGDAE